MYECTDCERRFEAAGRCADCGGRLINIGVYRD
jgi:rRNA maturation endonuclease Nob1